MGDLVATRLTLFDGAALALEGIEEKRLDVVRLKSARFGPFHFFADAVYTSCVHGIVGQCPFFDQILQLAWIESICDHLCQPGSHLGPLPIADRLNQEITQGLAFELELAQDIKHLASERMPGLFEFIQQRTIDIALSGFFCNKVPEVADLCLADTVDAPEALFDPVWIPV